MFGIKLRDDDDGDETRPVQEAPNAPQYREGSLELGQALRNFTQRPKVASGWRARTFVIPAGGRVQIADVNRQRYRIQVSTSAAAFIGPSEADPAGLSGNYADAFPLTAALSPIDMHHTGAIWASSVPGATVSVIEEYAARDA